MKKGKVRIKRKLSILLAVGLIAGSLALPSYAATGETVQEVQTIQTQYGEIQVETVLTVRDTALYSKTKSAEKTSTYRYAGSVIAKVTLEATFGYDGDSAWVVVRTLPTPPAAAGPIKMNVFQSLETKRN